MSIFNEDSTLEEKLTAIYTKAIHEIEIFSPKREPPYPSGYFAVYEAYKSASKNDKPELWRGILQEFGGYIDECNRISSENLSNRKFLEEMKAHFEKLGMLNYSEQIRLKLNEFEL